MADELVFKEVPGLRREPLQRRSGGTYQGRFQIPRPQWLANPDDFHAVASLSVRDIATAAENGLIWTDQLVQRGIKPGKEAEEELRVEAGYPDPDLYVFLKDKADAIANRLLEGDKGLKLSPLVWNLRPETFEGALHETDEGEVLYLYRGRIYLPDGHHRHQAILKAYRIWSESKGEYPEFDPERQFTVDVYFMSRRDEAEYFFQKNWLPQAVDRSKSYDLTEQDAFAKLAKRMVDKTDSLHGNVNRVTDRLGASNPQLVTLSTLREVVGIASDTDEGELTEEEIEQMAAHLSDFWKALVKVRPELGQLEAKERRESRKSSMAGQGVTMFGYAELMRRFLAESLEADDHEGVVEKWRKNYLVKLRANRKFTKGDWQGDYLDRSNPLWREVGVVQTTKSGGETISNTRQTRDQMATALVERVGL